MCAAKAQVEDRCQSAKVNMMALMKHAETCKVSWTWVSPKQAACTGQVEELGLEVLGEIEGTEVVFGSLEVRKSVVLAIHGSHVDGVADADVTVDNEVHLWYFLLFLVDNVLVFPGEELARLETKGYGVEELAVGGRGLKERPEVVEDVVVQVVDQQASFYLRRHHVVELVPVHDPLQSVILPVVFKVVVHLLVERYRQWVVVPEPPKRGSPLMQVQHLLFLCVRRSAYQITKSRKYNSKDNRAYKHV